MPTSKSKDIEDAYRWASCLTSEGRPPGWIADQFLWTDQATAARTKLQLGSGILLAVAGAIGTGKSSLHQALTHFTRGRASGGAYVLSLKWPESGGLHDNVFQRLLESSESFQRVYEDALRSRPGFDLNRPFGHQPKMSLAGGFKHLDHTLSVLAAQRRSPAAASEMALPPEEVTRARREALLTYFANADAILIDLPDYSRSDLRSLTRNLLDMQEIWRATLDSRMVKKAGHRANLVIFIQRETLDRRGAPTHYFLAKFHTIRLKSLSSSDLIRIYKLGLSGTRPFDEPLLERVAALSRGNPRRFLSYVCRCLEFRLAQGSSGGASLTLETLRKAIPDEQLEADLENEMVDLFPRSAEMRRKATLLVRFLTEQAPDQFSQAELASHLGLDAVEVSRLLPPLELGGFVERGKGVGAAKTVSAKL
ncbi:MAG: hypothetical protein ABSB26_08870 [Nitrososphaerales archaeon]|jgi:hypothetical protein